MCGFTVDVDGRVLEGVVRENEEAQDEYDEAVETGHAAFFLQEALPDVFKARVGNLMPGSLAKVRITYVTHLKMERGDIRFSLPATNVSPRLPAAVVYNE